MSYSTVASIPVSQKPTDIFDDRQCLYCEEPVCSHFVQFGRKPFHVTPQDIQCCFYHWSVHRVQRKQVLVWSGENTRMLVAEMQAPISAS